jgi:hypothetical protein
MANENLVFRIFDRYGLKFSEGLLKTNIPGTEESAADMYLPLRTGILSPGQNMGLLFLLNIPAGSL